MKEKEEIHDDENIIMKKIRSYYNEKYKNLSIEEKKDIFCRMIIEGNVKQQFDNNEFYKVLTPEEQKNAESIGYWDYITFLQKSFGYTKMLELLKIELLTEIIKDKDSFNKENAKEMKLYIDIL